MRITNQQLEGEIAALGAEADDRLVRARELFVESARLRVQADHLKRLLEIRSEAGCDSGPDSGLVSFVLVGLISPDRDEAAPACAVIWTGSADFPKEMQIRVRAGWNRAVPLEAVRYFNDMLDEWKRMSQSQPDTVLAMLSELSAGPVRAIQQGTMQKDRAVVLIEQVLGDASLMPGAALAK
ncbi:MAG TPA: hypothetical protein VKB38_03335 [Terracidiphilus sp.]|nr:hypothetical protein [Terracidiphilus sp.]